MRNAIYTVSFNSLIFKKTKQNYFLIVNTRKGSLIFYTTLKFKNIKDKNTRYKLTLSNFVTKLILKKIKIVVLELINFSFKLIKLTFSTLKTKGLYILNVIINIKKPHNGCRKETKTRKHKKRKFMVRKSTY